MQAAPERSLAVHPTGRVLPPAGVDMEPPIANDNDLLQHVCDVAADCQCCWFAWVGLVDRASDRIVPVAAAGYEDHYLEEIRVDISNTPYGRGPVGSAVRQECIWVVEDIERDLRMGPWKEAALSRGYRSVAAFPLRCGKRVVAVLAIYSALAEGFDSEQLARFANLAARVGVALESHSSRS